jgi:hypothetical protein
MAVRGTTGLRLGTIPSAKRRNHECNKVVEGEGEVLLLESGILKRAQIFSQEQDSRVKILGVYFISCEWATVSWAGGGLFIAPTSKRVVGESFTGQVRWTTLESGEKLFASRPGTGQVR